MHSVLSLSHFKLHVILNGDRVSKIGSERWGGGVGGWGSGFYYSIEPRERDGISKGAWPLVWKSQFVSLPTWAYFKGVLTSVVTVYRAMHRTMSRQGVRGRERERGGEGRKERDVERVRGVLYAHSVDEWKSR